LVEHRQSWVLKILPSWVGAITFGRHVFYRDAEPPEWLVKHEAVHVEQFKRYGFFGFLFRYCYGYFENGCDYRKIPLEVEAYKISSPE
jgi:hypothetical protein